MKSERTPTSPEDAAGSAADSSVDANGNGEAARPAPEDDARNVGRLPLLLYAFVAALLAAATVSLLR